MVGWPVRWKGANAVLNAGQLNEMNTHILVDICPQGGRLCFLFGYGGLIRLFTVLAKATGSAQNKLIIY